MSIKQYSILDAFRALDDLDEMEEVLTSKPLTESQAFDIRSESEMKEAEDILKSKEEEVTLKVIDADADTIEHLKNKEDYVGQFILSCKSCHTPRFIDGDKLVEDESEEGVFNKEDECPHCHNVGTGYEIIGQVGRAEFEKAEVLEEPEAEMPFSKEEIFNADAEALANAGGFEDIDVESGEEVEESGFEEISVESGESGDEEIEEALESGVVFESGNEVEEILAFLESGESGESGDFFDFLESGESGAEVEEVIIIESVEPKVTISEFFSKMIEPEHLRQIIIREDASKVLFKGSFEDLPEIYLDAHIKEVDSENSEISFTVGEGHSEESLKKYASCVAPKTSISVIDESTEIVFEGKAESLFTDSEGLVEKEIKLIEAPKLDFTIEPVEGEKRYLDESFKATTPEEKLAESIIVCNKLNPAKAEEFGSKEYWIVEDICNGFTSMPIEEFYTTYIVHAPKEIKEEFKSLTGYEDKLADYEYEAALKAQEEAEEKAALAAEAEIHKHAPEAESLEEDKESKKVKAGEILKATMDDWGSYDNPNQMRAAIIRCLDEHKDEMAEEDYKYAKMQFTNCKPSAVFGMVGTFITYLAMDPNKDNKKEEALVEDGSAIEDCKAAVAELDTLDLLKEDLELGESGSESSIEESLESGHLLESSESGESSSSIEESLESGASLTEDYIEMEESEINNLINKGLKEGCSFEVLNGFCDDKAILVEGLLKTADDEELSQFVIESISDKEVKVTNIVTEESFTSSI